MPFVVHPNLAWNCLPRVLSAAAHSLRGNRALRRTLAREGHRCRTLRYRAAAGRSVLQPLAKALPARCLEVRARGSDLFRVALAGPDRQSILEASNRSLAVLRPVAGKALTVSHAELHVSGGPFFWIGLAGPDRQGVFEGEDSPLQVFCPVPGGTLQIGCAELHASGSPLFWVRFAGPDRENILESLGGPLPVLRLVAVS